MTSSMRGGRERPTTQQSAEFAGHVSDDSENRSFQNLKFQYLTTRYYMPSSQMNTWNRNTPDVTTRQIYLTGQTVIEVHFIWSSLELVGSSLG